jgi:hypothetical protein
MINDIVYGNIEQLFVVEYNSIMHAVPASDTMQIEYEIKGVLAGDIIIRITPPFVALGISYICATAANGRIFVTVANCGLAQGAVPAGKHIATIGRITSGILLRTATFL